MSYRQIFEEAIGESPPSRIDVDRVVRRQRRAARVRPALATLAAVLMVAGGGGIAVELTDDEGSPVPDPAAPVVTFPEYLKGTRVVASVSAPVADRVLSLTFTPTSPDPVFYTQCEPFDVGGSLQGEVTVGSVDHTADICAHIIRTSPSETIDPLVHHISSFWEAADVTIGEPITITVRLTDFYPTEGRGEVTDPPSEGLFGLGVAEPVPFEEYVFPSRPEVLEPLREVSESEEDPDDVVLRAEPGDWNARVEMTINWDESLAGCGPMGSNPILSTSQTPGSLRVLLNGAEVENTTWWDYEQQARWGGHPICDELEPGEQVTIAVEPANMTGAWRVLLNRSDG